jgi:hypothetical protein
MWIYMSRSKERKLFKKLKGVALREVIERKKKTCTATKMSIDAYA